MANAFDMSNPRRTGMDLVRWGGLAAVLAGGVSAASGIAHFALVYPEAGTGPANSLSNYLIESAHAIAEAGMLGALLGLRARQALRYGWLGKTGFIVAFLGTALLCAITVIAVITKDALGEAVLGSVFISGVLGWLVGFPPLGIATLRARMLPRWVGVLLIAYFPLFAFLLGSYGWGGIALGLLWLALGYALLSQHFHQAAGRRPGAGHSPRARSRTWSSRREAVASRYRQARARSVAILPSWRSVAILGIRSAAVRATGTSRGPSPAT